MFKELSPCVGEVTYLQHKHILAAEGEVWMSCGAGRGMNHLLQLLLYMGALPAAHRLYLCGFGLALAASAPVQV